MGHRSGTGARRVVSWRRAPSPRVRGGQIGRPGGPGGARGLHTGGKGPVINQTRLHMWMADALLGPILGGCLWGSMTVTCEVHSQ